MVSIRALSKVIFSFSRVNRLAVLAVTLSMSGFSLASAALKPEKVHTAESKKLDAYIRDGLFVGGDRAIEEVSVKNIRFARNTGYERIVIDLSSLRGGETPAIERAPFYQAAVSPDEGRLVLSLFGRPHLEFDAKRVAGVFKKSTLVNRAVFLPKLDQDVWVFSLELRGKPSIEVFELTNPPRIIVDLRTVSKKSPL